MDERPPIAHRLPDTTPPVVETMAEHEEQVAELAEAFASAFGCGPYGKFLGLAHDLGKYRPDFQRRIWGENIPAEHAIVGACWVMELLGDDIGTPLAFAIAGHHAGLANHIDAKDTAMAALKDRLREKRDMLEQVRARVVALPRPDFNTLPPMTLAPDRRAFWTRMLFSALVDADFLATERFMNPGRAASRKGGIPLAPLRERLHAYLQGLMDNLPPEQRGSTVNTARAEILAHCRAAADLGPGFFSLTVPTGGGKTLSSMAFALDHAAQHGLRRVIVVLPYTTIIEQNAEAIGKAIGPEHVLEHHSNLTRPKRAESLEQERTAPHERAEENWDAPVIVTTNVQFFESLFANRPSRCRKLHNIARSVIILDEVQTLPVGFLLPILNVLNHLVHDYGCTIVLSTATPPALNKRPNLPAGLADVRPIVPEAALYFRMLERVRYHWPDSPVTDWPALAHRIAQHPQVLAVVHKRQDARDLAEELAAQTGEHVWHLSALMCPAHRRQVIAEIRAALQDGRPCRVVSTQLIEAGVDLDFPVVYRAMAGLDSIVQAAGRCNREGRLERGDVYLFRAPTSPPKGILTKALEASETMLRADPQLNPHDPGQFEVFFRLLYGKQSSNMDLRAIRPNTEEMNFATVAKEFRLIDDSGQLSVVCPFEDAALHLEALRLANRLGRTGREHFRALQPYIVTVFSQQAKQLIQDGTLTRVLEDSDVNLWSAPCTTAYTMEFGLELSGARADPEALII
jgi:CRISPR-associated endonuclease/helicase Cas3